jgi:hypothetical protein
MLIACKVILISYSFVLFHPFLGADIGADVSQRLKSLRGLCARETQNENGEHHSGFCIGKRVMRSTLSS